MSPTDTLSLISWAITIGVPILVGWLVSKFLEGQPWFQELNSKNAVVVALSALLGFALDQLRRWLMASPDTLNAVDPYVKSFLAMLTMYLTTQVTHGAMKARKIGLRKIEVK